MNVEKHEEMDEDLIAKMAYEEQDAEREGREPKDFLSKPEKDDEEETETNDDPNEPEIDEVPVEDTEEETEETEDEEPKLEKDGEEESETQEPDLDTVITEHAQKYKMTYAEAKDDIEKIDGIVEQFKSDPKELAQALRNKDREYDKLKNESVKKESEAEPVFQALTESQFRNIAIDKIDNEPDKYVDAYKKRYPAKAELMSDEAIIEEIVDREYVGYQSYAKEQEVDIKTNAISKRDEILSGISEEDRRFLPDVKALLSKLTDVDVLSPDFDSTYLIHISKGKNFDKEIKAAEERGYRRAKDGATILGVKSRGKQKPTQKAIETSLSEDQKHRAEEMFPESDGYSKEKAYAEFKDTFKDALKKDPQYI